jgi:hypothetical protein
MDITTNTTPVGRGRATASDLAVAGLVSQEWPGCSPRRSCSYRPARGSRGATSAWVPVGVQSPSIMSLAVGHTTPQHGAFDFDYLGPQHGPPITFGTLDPATKRCMPSALSGTLAHA